MKDPSDPHYVITRTPDAYVIRWRRQSIWADACIELTPTYEAALRENLDLVFELEGVKKSSRDFWDYLAATILRYYRPAPDAWEKMLAHMHDRVRATHDPEVPPGLERLFRWQNLKPGERF